MKGSHDPYAKVRLTLVPKVRRPLRKPPPENQKGATGESFRGYSKIHLALQGNRLGGTGEFPYVSVRGKPKGPTDADVHRLVDEIKFLKRPPTMTEVRDYSVKLFGKNVGRAVYSLLKEDFNKYGLQVVKGDTLAEKLIVSL